MSLREDMPVEDLIVLPVIGPTYLVTRELTVAGQSLDQ